MVQIKRSKPYKLSDIITIVTNAIIADNFNSDDKDFCLFTKKYEEVATAELVLFVDDYPNITDEDEEIYSDFVINESLKLFCHGHTLEMVVENVLYQKSEPTMENYIFQLNYYMDNDSFMKFERND